MVDVQVWDGVTSLLDSYAEIEPEDSVVILYTSDSFEQAAWVEAALEIRLIDVSRVWMAPLKDDGFSSRLNMALPAPDTLRGRLVVLSFERDTMSHTTPLNEALSAYPPHRRLAIRAISASPSLFASALAVTPDELTALNTSLLERLMFAKRLRIETAGGTDLSVELDSDRFRWISNRGRARRGGTVIIPAGEVATYPAAINGTLVADFAFNVNAVTDRDARLGAHPVTVTIEDGRATKVDCADHSTMSFLDECFFTHCAYHVGELGLGTNYKVTDAIAMNSHINERRPGVHIGFGQHNQDPDVVGYQCSIHLDLIARGAMIWTDTEPTPIDLESVEPSDSTHPTKPSDQDVFAVEELDVDDCCGILGPDGIRLFQEPTHGAGEPLER